jgi:hypothetical protein
MTVITLAWNYMPYAATGIFDIALSARNEMNMAVKDCLTGYSTNINPNIEALNILIRG